MKRFLFIKDELDSNDFINCTEDDELISSPMNISGNL